MRPKKPYNGILSSGRRPQLEPVPFKEILPLAIKDKVSGKGGRTTDVVCIQEMSVMFSCLKSHEFNEIRCGKEIQGFQNCITQSNESTRKALEIEKKLGAEKVIPGSTSLNARQLNHFLRKFPIPK
ncbi:Serine/threonine-protein phosphatase 6 regulatory subunit 3 [Chamberlinius hualienensis]